MKEEARSSVSRRDFLKDFGGGVIGTAVISAGLLSPNQIEGAQSAAGRAAIPKDLKPTPHLDEIRKRMEMFRDDLKSFGVVQVNLRLNQSATDMNIPFFIDWVGTPETRSTLSGQGLTLAQSGHRFGDPIRSAVYDEAVGPTPKIIERDWCTPGKLKEKAAQSQLLAQRAGAMYQIFIGIKAAQDGQSRCVGLLTAGFPQKIDASKKKQLEDKLKEWAGWTRTQKELVNYLVDNCSLGGPIAKNEAPKKS
jgi:hypothetical protein